MARLWRLWVCDIVHCFFNPALHLNPRCHHHVCKMINSTKEKKSGMNDKSSYCARMYQSYSQAHTHKYKKLHGSTNRGHMIEGWFSMLPFIFIMLVQHAFVLYNSTHHDSPRWHQGSLALILLKRLHHSESESESLYRLVIFGPYGVYVCD